jgi:5-oxoprolinase (ATP-hydrolysing)
VIAGPAIVAERNATTIVEPGWRARITALDHLLLERIAPRRGAPAIGTSVDPVLLEVFNNLFMNIAEQMGCSCRTPPTRSTSRSGSTSPARCSTPTAT